MSAWCYLREGRWIDLADPAPGDIRLDDIALGLAAEPRFRGMAAGVHYSVAEHSALAVTLALHGGVTYDPALRAILMHDAPEAFLGDKLRPLRALLPDFNRVHDRLAGVIAARFGLGAHDGLVARYDALAYAVECRRFDRPPPDDVPPGDVDRACCFLGPDCLRPTGARQRFMGWCVTLGLS